MKKTTQRHPSLSLPFLIFIMAAPFSFAATPSRTHTTRPMVTGTSVVGLVYQGGVLLAADTLLSYGSMAKCQNAQRLHALGSSVLLGGSGEYSDYNKVVRLLQQKQLEETRTGLVDAGSESQVTAESTWNYLRMLFYSRRNKMNPFWNELLVAGFNKSNEQPFLGMVDKIGTTISDNVLATGFGAWLALPLLREKWRPDLTEGEARALLEDCMKVLFLRDCRASPQIQLAKCTKDANGKVVSVVSEPYILETLWESAEFMRPVADLDGDGGW